MSPHLHSSSSGGMGGSCGTQESEWHPPRWQRDLSIEPKQNDKHVRTRAHLLGTHHQHQIVVKQIGKNSVIVCLFHIQPLQSKIGKCSWCQICNYLIFHWKHHPQLLSWRNSWSTPFNVNWNQLWIPYAYPRTTMEYNRFTNLKDRLWLCVQIWIYERKTATWEELGYSLYTIR